MAFLSAPAVVWKMTALPSGSMTPSSMSVSNVAAAPPIVKTLPALFAEAMAKTFVPVSSGENVPGLSVPGSAAAASSRSTVVPVAATVTSLASVALSSVPVQN